MRIPRPSSIGFYALLGCYFPLFLIAQDRVSEFNAMGPLPAHAPKVLQAAVIDALPGSRVSVEGERVKIRTSHGVQEEFLLDLLLSTNLGTFTPVDRPEKRMERERAGFPASGSLGPPDRSALKDPSD